MITETETSGGPITRAEWANVVARNSGTPVRPHPRRIHKRFRPPTGTAKLVFTLPSGTRTVPVVYALQILDISDGGLAVKCEHVIPLKTGMGLDVDIEGTPLLMMGKVARCTSTVGGYEIGIELIFTGDIAGSDDSRDRP